MPDTIITASTAKDLSRNPLGIIALFIVLVYGIAALTLAATSSVQPDERSPLIWFLVTFPPLVLGTFAWLVSRHHEKLYGPGDYKTDAGFLDAAKARAKHTEELQAQQDNLKSKVRAVLASPASGAGTDSEKSAQLVNRVISEIDKATTITVDASSFLGEPSAIFVFPIAAFDRVDALTNEIYFRLTPKVRAFEYGHSWQLRNKDTKQVVKTRRVITRTAPGERLVDDRTLQEIGVLAGAVLEVEVPK